MAAKVGSFKLNDVTGNQAITGVGFTPTIVIFFWTGASATDGSGEPDAKPGIGAMTATAQFACASWVRDGQPIADSSSVRWTSRCIMWEDPGSADAEASFVSMNLDGFTINVDGAPSVDEARVVGYLALDGDAAIIDWATPLVTGDHGVTGAGFEPSGVIHVALGPDTSDNADGVTGPNMDLMLGAMDAAGNQWVQGLYDDDGADPMATAVLLSQDTCIDQRNGNTPGGTSNVPAATFGSMGSDGFTVNFSRVAEEDPTRVFSICIGGTQAAKVGSVRASSTGSQQTTEVGVGPDAVMFAGAGDGATFPGSGATVYDSGVIGWGIGAASSPADEVATYFHDRDAVGTSEAEAAAVASRCIVAPSESNIGSAFWEDEAELTSLDDDGFTLNWLTVSGADFGYLAFGAASIDATVTPGATAATSVSVPGATPEAGASKTPAVVAAVASAPAPVASAGVSKEPATLVSMVVAPGASISTGATVTATTIPAVVSLGRVTIDLFHVGVSHELVMGAP